MKIANMTIEVIGVEYHFSYFVKIYYILGYKRLFSHDCIFHTVAYSNSVQKTIYTAFSATFFAFTEKLKMLLAFLVSD